jgi:hypothetical protein
MRPSEIYKYCTEWYFQGPITLLRPRQILHLYLLKLCNKKIEEIKFRLRRFLIIILKNMTSIGSRNVVLRFGELRQFCNFDVIRWIENHVTYWTAPPPPPSPKL